MFASITRGRGHVLCRQSGTRNISTLTPTIKQLFLRHVSPEPERVQVNGWIKSLRQQKRVSFAIVTDGTTHDGLQVVFSDPAMVSNDLGTGSSVQLVGALVSSPGTKQDRELVVESCVVVGHSDPETYPIQKKELSTEFLRTLPHFRARTQAHAHIIRERDRLMRGFHDFFGENGFTYIDTPILTENDCEGGGQTFSLAPPAPEMFSHPAFLTVSAQLHLEAMAASFPRVYTISPAFRAETSATSRHLSEFWMLEAEIAFADTLDQVMDVVEGSVRAVLPEPMRGVTQWPRISYSEAISELSKASTEFQHGAPQWGNPLRSEHERWLADVWANESPVFVTSYPSSQKPFYMLANDDGTVACFDLLVPRIGELVGGSLREHRLEQLQDAMHKHRLNKQGELDWYIDLRRWGGTPHGGFGLGIERMISWITGTNSVKECIAFPRWSGRWLL